MNWELAHDLARQVAVAEGDPSVSRQDTRDVAGAFSAAEAWLDAATDLPAAGGPVRTWCRSDWVEHTMARWRTLAEPVAASVADALVAALRTQAPDAVATFDAQGVDIGGQMMRQLGGAVFGMQVGQAAGTLAREVFGSTDIGLPLIEGRGTALVPRNVADFAAGLDVPVDEVRLFLALREASHARLFTHVSWLRAYLLGTVEAYARGITIDMSSLEEAVRSIDPTDPQALRDALSEGVFSLDTTPEQEAALLRLETALALVEGWVDEVTAAAARPHLPHTAALREMMRRRRAAGGPAEDTFATLVGLELRPRRSRDAAKLWALISAEDGQTAREQVWDHPDLLPRPEDLDDPAGYRARLAAEVTEHDDVDRAIAAIFGEEDSARSDVDADADPDETDGTEGPEAEKAEDAEAETAEPEADDGTDEDGQADDEPAAEAAEADEAADEPSERGSKD